MYKIEKSDEEIKLEDLFPDLMKTRKEATFLDDNNNIVEKEKATKVIIREYDEKNHLVRETWGSLTPAKTK